MPLSHLEILIVILAGAAVFALVLGIFLWINAWLIKKETGEFARAQKAREKSQDIDIS